MTGARPVHDDDFGELEMEPDAGSYDYPYDDDDGPTGFEHPCPVCNGTGQPVGEFSACYKCYGEGYLDD